MQLIPKSLIIFQNVITFSLLIKSCSLNFSHGLSPESTAAQLSTVDLSSSELSQDCPSASQTPCQPRKFRSVQTTGTVQPDSLPAEEVQVSTNYRHCPARLPASRGSSGQYKLPALSSQTPCQPRKLRSVQTTGTVQPDSLPPEEVQISTNYRHCPARLPASRGSSGHYKPNANAALPSSLPANIFCPGRCSYVLPTVYYTVYYPTSCT